MFQRQMWLLEIFARFVLCPVLVLGGTGNLRAEVKLTAYPPTVRLAGKSAYQQLLVTSQDQGQKTDVTQQARFRSLHPKIVQVAAGGIVQSQSDGRGTILIEFADQQVKVEVESLRTADLQRVSFELEVQPILVERGCSSGACHGKARGQNGFQL